MKKHLLLTTLISTFITFALNARATSGEKRSNACLVTVSEGDNQVFWTIARGYLDSADDTDSSSSSVLIPTPANDYTRYIYRFHLPDGFIFEVLTSNEVPYTDGYPGSMVYHLSGTIGDQSFKIQKEPMAMGKDLKWSERKTINFQYGNKSVYAVCDLLTPTEQSNIDKYSVANPVETRSVF